MSITEIALNDSWNIRDFSPLEPPNAQPKRQRAWPTHSKHRLEDLCKRLRPKILQVHPTKSSTDFRLPSRGMSFLQKGQHPPRCSGDAVRQRWPIAGAKVPRLRKMKLSRGTIETMRPLMKPLDSGNKPPRNFIVEAYYMTSICNGNVVTDHQGFAYVDLPAHFDAVNRDIRYLLTVVGQFAQAIVLRKVQNNRFTIKTYKPGVEVSWQVTSVRHHAWANQVLPDHPANFYSAFRLPE